MGSSTSILETITFILTDYGYSIILILGDIGNILNIILFLRKKLRTTSCSNYFLASAFTNLLALNISIISLLYTQADPSIVTTTYCKTRNYIMNICLQMSRYLILTACFDRYALCSPNAYLRKFCTVRIARRYVIPFIITICFIMPIHIPIYTIADNYSCIMHGVVALYNSIYGVTMVGIVPPGLMLLFSFLIFRNLKLRGRRRQVLPVNVNNTVATINGNQRTQVKDEQVFAMLLIQVLAYVISSTPFTVSRLYLVLKVQHSDDETMEEVPIFKFILFFTDMLRFFCPFTSFYLFMIASRLYRKEMRLTILNIYHRCCPLFKRRANHLDLNTNVIRNGTSLRT